MSPTLTIDILNKACSTMTNLTFKSDISHEFRGDWIVEGIVSTDAVDHGGDIVTREGLESLALSMGGNRQPTVLFNHDPSRPIGRLLDTKVVNLSNGFSGLWAKLRISKAEPELWEKIKDGTISKFSFSAEILAADLKFDSAREQEVRLIVALKGFEYSLVSIPMNNTTDVTAAFVKKHLTENGDRKMKDRIPESDGTPETKKSDEKSDESKKTESTVESKKIDIAELIKGLSDEAKQELIKSLTPPEKSEDLTAGESDKTTKTEDSETDKKAEKSTKKDSVDEISEAKKLIEETKTFISDLKKHEEDEEEKSEKEELMETVKELTEIVGSVIGILKNVPIRKSLKTEELSKSEEKSDEQNVDEETEASFLDTDDYKKANKSDKREKLSKGLRSLLQNLTKDK